MTHLVAILVVTSVVTFIVTSVVTSVVTFVVTFVVTLGNKVVEGVFAASSTRQAAFRLRSVKPEKGNKKNHFLGD